MIIPITTPHQNVTSFPYEPLPRPHNHSIGMSHFYQQTLLPTHSLNSLTPQAIDNSPDQRHLPVCYCYYYYSASRAQGLALSTHHTRPPVHCQLWPTFATHSRPGRNNIRAEWPAPCSALAPVGSGSSSKSVCVLIGKVCTVGLYLSEGM